MEHEPFESQRDHSPPERPRYRLADLMEGIPDEPLPRLQDWEDAPSVGLERLTHSTSSSCADPHK